MKIYQSLECEKILSALMKKPFPFKTAYKLNKINEIINKDVQFYAEQIKLITQEFAKKDENGNFILGEGGATIQIQEDKIKECHEKMNELLNCEVGEVTIKIKPEEFDGIDFTMEQLQALMPFIEE